MKERSAADAPAEIVSDDADCKADDLPTADDACLHDDEPPQPPPQTPKRGKQKKTSPRKSAKRAAKPRPTTDESDEVYEEAVVDGFPIASFKTPEDLQTWVEQDEERRRKELEATLGSAALTSTPAKAARRPRRPKAADTTPSADAVSSASSASASPPTAAAMGAAFAEKMAIKRELEPGDVGGLLAKVPKLDGHSRQTSSVPDRPMTPLLLLGRDGVSSSASFSADSKAGAVFSHAAAGDPAASVAPPPQQLPGANAPNHFLAPLGLLPAAARAAAVQQHQQQQSLLWPGLPGPLMAAASPFGALPPGMQFGLLNPYAAPNFATAASSRPPQLPPTSAPSTPSAAASSSMRLPAQRGKWCALHVEIAWSISKKRFGDRSASRGERPAETAAHSSQTDHLRSASAQVKPENADLPLPLLTDSTIGRRRHEAVEQQRASSTAGMVSRCPSTVNGEASSSSSATAMAARAAAEGAAGQQNAMTAALLASLQNMNGNGAQRLDAANFGALPFLGGVPATLAQSLVGAGMMNGALQQPSTSQHLEALQLDALRRQQLGFSAESLQRQQQQQQQQQQFLLAPQQLFGAAANPYGLLPFMTATGGADALYPRMPAFGGFGGGLPFMPQMGASKLTAPFSSTLEQLARQRQHLPNNHSLNR